MIKNESKIIERSLKSVEGVVDAFCVCDTGSTDNTVEIVNKFLETHTGCLTVEPWKNFGYNRTISFQRAKDYVKNTLKWDLENTYGLLLDADMVFIPGTLKSQKLDKQGYSILQQNGHISYYNCRLVRFDYDWTCVGVTHEYWGGPASNNLDKTICYIDDRNDGGCKSDKIPRDIRLLEQGLKDEPGNGRYMFYLAQSYKDCGRLDDAIKMYKKRIKTGGWDEEVWYSHYTIGQCYLGLKDVYNFERWMQKANDLRPTRGEPMYALAQFFRLNSRHYKAYEYIKTGRQISYPKDVLFVEDFCHTGGFDYEASIIDYYIHSDKKVGLRSSIQYLLKNNTHFHNVISNIKFYMSSISSDIKNLNLPTPFGDVFRPSAISVVEYPYANVRYVNYQIQPDGSYTMPNGIVETKNAYVNLESNEYTIIKDPVPIFESHIRGLEDLRLTKHNGKYYFTATSYKQYIPDKISIVHGEYDPVKGEVSNYRGIQSPTGQDCEKNWVCFPETDTYIYSWSPMRIGKIIDNRFQTVITYDTPPLFSHFRGSAPPVRIGDNWVVLVHFVEYATPRKYYHCFVELNSRFKPTRISLPFFFRENRIEFCISVVKQDNFLDCYASMNDCNPARVRIPSSSLEWMNVDTTLQNTVSEPIINRVKSYPENITSFWDGGYSRCLVNGSIHNFINTLIEKTDISFTIPMSDGILDEREYNRLFKELNRIPDSLSKDNIFSKSSIVGILCSRYTRPKNALYLPLDDDTFQYGLKHVLSSTYSPNWKDRTSKVFWRGGSSGYDRPSSIRMRVTDKLYDKEYSDVRITKWGNWENEHNIPEKHFGDRCGLDKHFLYKYILIVDGNCIASNHQWVFGSGAVPIMITHPNNEFWFRKYLQPMVNYVPIQYDLSDLTEKIEWLIANDDKAKEIAENAMKFANTIFTPEFQRWYIEGELIRIRKNETSLLRTQYMIKKAQPSDINEHLETLYEYAKKCDTIVECGVCNIVSSYAFTSGLLGNDNNKFVMVDPYKSGFIDSFLTQAKSEGINIRFIEDSDIKCELVDTDLLFIDTLHVYGQLKRELEYWNQHIRKYIIMHDTTVDEWDGEIIRGSHNAEEFSKKTGIPVEEINKGLWPAIDEFLKEHTEWKLEKRFTHNNGLTILSRT